MQDFAAFEWAEPAAEVLDWNVRKPRILSELRQWNADVVCLQEVQFEKNSERFELPRWLQELEGYEARVPNQSQLVEMAERNKRVLGVPAPVGNALLFRSDRLEAVPSALPEAQTTRVAVVLRGRNDLSHLQPTIVYSLHLDATSEHKRVKQIASCLEGAETIRVRQVIIAGDLNTELKPGSCVGALLAESPPPSLEEMSLECSNNLRLPEGASPDDDQLKAHQDLFEIASALTNKHRIPVNRVQTGHTRSSYDHGKKCGPCVPWKLDHIFFSGQSLKARAHWETLEGDAASMESGLPNRWCPSDHLPIGASFEQLSVPSLTEADRDIVRAKFSALEQNQLKRVEEWREASELERRAIELEEAGQTPKYDTQHLQQQSSTGTMPAPPSNDKKKVNKTKMAKRGRPSDRVVDFFQKSRGALKVLQDELCSEREAFIAALNDLQLDVLEALVRSGNSRGTIREWGSTGSPLLAKAAKANK